MVDSMRRVSRYSVISIPLLVCSLSVGLPCHVASADGGCNAYIYGMHDYNSTVRDLLTYSGQRRGWVLVLQSLEGYTGGYNSDVVNAGNDGLGVLVRLHWGYGTAGTLPPQSQYNTFASRASLFIQTHINYCKFYQIGNEPNLCCEWPGGGAADGRCDPSCSSVREWITADRYADCFQRVYNALPTSIKSTAKLCLQPTAVWAGFFRCAWQQDFDTDDFICYAQQCYNKIPHYMIGGLTFHPKTHNHNPSEIIDPSRSGAVFGCGQNEQVYWYFWVYKDLLDDIPTDLRDRGIFFTELNPHEGGWTNNNNGYCVDAYDEVDYWNSTHSNRKITAMMLYRWDDGDSRWDIWSRPGVQQDLQAAVAQGQTSNGMELCGGAPPPTPTPEPPSGQNLSEGKSAYASSQYGPSWGPEKAVDGVISSSYKWCSQSQSPTWWYVDLGQICEVNTVKVFCESYVGEAAYYNLRQYTVRASNTTSVPVSSWLTISSYDSGGGDGAAMVQHDVSGAYRYVGLRITDSGIDNYSRVLEVQVFGDTDPPTFRIEAEDYDNYYDTTSGNSGGAYRSDNVDIEAVQNDDGRYNVGWTAASEWLDFSLKVAASNYDLYVRHAGTSNGSIHIELDGDDKTGSISLPSTGGWQTWATKDAGTIYIGPGNHTLRIYEETAGYNINYLRFVPTGSPGGPLPIEENFEAMPSWSSQYDAGWGSAASWSIQSGGQYGNYLQASRSSQGSSAKALVYTVPTNTDITISIYMRCPSFGGTYWMETAYRLGNYTAQDFDENSGSWTMIKKFSNSGTNGNGNNWVEYQKEVNTGSNTQISIGFKLGSSGGGGPTVGWDTLVIDESQYFGFETSPGMEFIGWETDESAEPGVSEVGRACEAMPVRQPLREDS